MILNNYNYIKLYIDIATSMSWALSIFVLLISVMQSVNEVQSLNNTPIFL